MVFRRAFMMVMLTLGLLLLPGAAAAEKIQRSTDQQGTIHIGNTGPAGQEKAGEAKAEEKAGAEKAQSGTMAPGQEPPPGLIPPKSRRHYGPEAEARRKALLERRQSQPAAPAATAPEAPPARLSPQPPPESP